MPPEPAIVDRDPCYGDAFGRRLYLESNSRLMPALALHASAGFCHEPRPEPSDHERADAFMVWRGAAGKA